MSGSDPFFDASVLLYLLSDDTAKADRIEIRLSALGVVSCGLPTRSEPAARSSSPDSAGGEQPL